MYSDDKLLYKPICCQEEWIALQGDVDKLELGAITNFSAANCKCIHGCLTEMSWTQTSTSALQEPTVELVYVLNLKLEQVDQFKYLSLLLSSDVESISKETIGAGV